MSSSRFPAPPRVDLVLLTEEISAALKGRPVKVGHLTEAGEVAVNDADTDDAARLTPNQRAAIEQAIASHDPPDVMSRWDVLDAQLAEADSVEALRDAARAVLAELREGR